MSSRILSLNQHGPILVAWGGAELESRGIQFEKCEFLGVRPPGIASLVHDGRDDMLESCRSGGALSGNPRRSENEVLALRKVDFSRLH